LQDLELLAGFEFDTSDEGMQVLGHLRLLLHGINEDFAGFVVDPGDEIEEALVGVSGKEGANVGEYSAKDHIGMCVGLPANLSTHLLALDTGFANVRGKGVTTDDLHALGHPLVCHAQNVIGVKVTEATVPDVDRSFGTGVVSDQHNLRELIAFSREGVQDSNMS
jgi:hypothetical protein